MTLKERIIKSEYPAQSVLSESTLAKDLGTSRTPVREALARLETEGWVQTLTGKGVIVCAPTLREIDEMFDLRLAFERHVVFEIFRYERNIDLSPLRGVCQRQVKALEEGDLWAYFVLNGSFHRELVALLGNEVMLKITDDLRDKQMQSGYQALAKKANLGEAIHEHHMILDALEQRDQGKALHAIEHHIAGAKRRLHGF